MVPSISRAYSTACSKVIGARGGVRAPWVGEGGMIRTEA